MSFDHFQGLFQSRSTLLQTPLAISGFSRLGLALLPAQENQSFSRPAMQPLCASGNEQWTWRKFQGWFDWQKNGHAGVRPHLKRGVGGGFGDGEQDWSSRGARRRPFILPRAAASLSVHHSLRARRGVAPKIRYELEVGAA